MNKTSFALFIIPFSLFFNIHRSFAQVEVGVFGSAHKFFGSANSAFQIGGGGQFSLGWRNIFYLQAEHAAFLSNQFTVVERLDAFNPSNVPAFTEIDSETSAELKSWGLNVKFVWARPEPKKRNQFYLTGGVNYFIYSYIILKRGSYQSSDFRPVLPESDRLTAVMLNLGIGYEVLIGKNAGLFGEVSGYYPLTRRSYEFFEDLEIPSSFRLNLGMRFRFLKGKAEI